jgi:hypothetical protein
LGIAKRNKGPIEKNAGSALSAFRADAHAIAGECPDLDAEFDAEVARWCVEIVEKRPTAIAKAKRFFNADTAEITGTGDMGMQALEEKRKPGFRNPVKWRRGAYAGLRTSSSALPSPSEG